MTTSLVVQMLWVGGPLSKLERLALTSWLAHGHEVHLYSYGKPANTPRGLCIRDAKEILPAAPGTSEATPGAGPMRFSDRFAYTLLHERGGIWAEIDLVCLRPLDFAQNMDYFFASEVLPAQPGDEGRVRVRASACVMKAPAHSPVLRECMERAAGVDARADDTASTGPLLLHDVVEKFHLTSALLNPNVFCPVPFWNLPALISGLTVLPPESHGVHFWNESWRRNLFDKNASYEPHCLYERLKAHYLKEKGN